MKGEKFEAYGELCDLPGMPSRVVGRTARSQAAAMRCLHRHGVCTRAGDHGSITIWQSKDGKYRGEFNRYKAVVSQISADSERYLAAWLRVWWPATDDWATLAKLMKEKTNE